jgi:GNAT superfamily N-acetyltransferase
MRWELRRVADLTAGEQAALRNLSLAVYPPEVAAAWPGRAIEWAAAQWGVIGFDAGGVALCYVGVILREARWNDRAVRAGGIGGVKTHPASRGRGFATTAIRRALDFFHEQGMSISACWSASRAWCRSTTASAGAGSPANSS